MATLTHRQQLAKLGISAEAYEDLVIIETERTFLSLTPLEVRVFHPCLQGAYRTALHAAPARELERVVT